MEAKGGLEKGWNNQVEDNDGAQMTHFVASSVGAFSVIEWGKEGFWRGGSLERGPRLEECRVWKSVFRGEVCSIPLKIAESVEGEDVCVFHYSINSWFVEPALFEKARLFKKARLLKNPCQNKFQAACFCGTSSRLEFLIPTVSEWRFRRSKSTCQAQFGVFGTAVTSTERFLFL